MLSVQCSSDTYPHGLSVVRTLSMPLLHQASGLPNISSRDVDHFIKPPMWLAHTKMGAYLQLPLSISRFSLAIIPAQAQMERWCGNSEQGIDGGMSQASRGGGCFGNRKRKRKRIAEERRNKYQVENMGLCIE